MYRMRSFVPLCAALSLVSTVLFAQGPANPDFQTVTSKLDSGGSYFMFVDTRGGVDKVADMVEKFTSAVPEPQVRLIPGFVRAGGKALGFGSIEAVGESMVPFGDGGARQKAYLLMRKPEGVFALLGRPDTPMQIAKHAPADSAMAGIKNVKFGEIVPLVRRTAGAILGAAGESAVNGFLGEAKKNGVDIEAILDSFAGESLFWLRLDDANKVELGMGDKALHVARPGLAMALRTKSPALYETLKGLSEKRKTAMTVAKDAEGGEMLVAQVGENPFGFQPTFAQRGDVFIVATAPSDLALTLESAKGPGLFESAAFKKISEGLPAAPSSVAFVSPRVGAYILDVLEQLERDTNPGDAAPFAMARAFVGMAMPGKDGIVIWSVWDDDGVLLVTQGDKVERQFSQSGATLAAPVMAAIAVPNFLEAGVRSKVSRVRADQRSFATALEAYFVDNNAYPAMASDPDDYAGSKGLAEKGIPSFRRHKGPGHPMALTTPIAYLTRHLPDAFGGEGDSFGYYTVQGEKTSGWIVWSPGPDKRYDLDWKVYDPDVPQPSTELIPYMYDPTNGTVSRGDIFRVKQ